MMLEETRRYYSRLPKSINNHSIRVYRWDDSNIRFALDRTTDTSPRFFTLYTFFERPGNRLMLSKIIKVGGRDEWGDDLSWGKAIRLAEQAIKEYLDLTS